MLVQGHCFPHDYNPAQDWMQHRSQISSGWQWWMEPSLPPRHSPQILDCMTIRWIISLLNTDRTRVRNPPLLALAHATESGGSSFRCRVKRSLTLLGFHLGSNPISHVVAFVEKKDVLSMAERDLDYGCAQWNVAPCCPQSTIQRPADRLLMVSHLSGFLAGPGSMLPL